MKPRIKQFAKKCGFRSYVTVSDGNNNHITTEIETNLQKFAELIIQECHEVIVVGGVDDLDGVMKHFEIE